MEEHCAPGVAWVIGGTSGIGYAVAMRLAPLHKHVIIAGRDLLRGQRAVAALGAGGPHAFVSLDVRDADSYQQQLAHMLTTWGTPDAVFLSTGRDCAGHVDELDLAEWEDTMAANLRSAYLLLHAVLPPMRARRTGVIVVNASVKGLLAHPEDPVYCATKAALIMLVRSVSLDVAKAGIRVNAVCPGPVATRLLQDSEMVARRVPLGRVATAGEVADVVAFLLSDQAAFITGAAVPVDGGKSAGLLPLTREWRELALPD